MTCLCQSTLCFGFQGLDIMSQGNNYFLDNETFYPLLFKDKLIHKG